MQSVSKKILIVVAIILVIFCAFLLWIFHSKPPKVPPKITEAPKSLIYKIIGTSVQGRKIESYTYGNGKEDLVFVGGIHGGYEWNGVLLAYQLMDYLDKNIDTIPSNLTVTVIPDVNPDGV